MLRAVKKKYLTARLLSGIIRFVMEKIVEQGILYDFYGPLLTQHQQEVYEACVFEDLSLAEAAERFEVSRQNIHDLVKRCDKSLKDYEKRLGLIARFRENRDSLESIRDLLAKNREADGSRKFSGAEINGLLQAVDHLLDEI